MEGMNSCTLAIFAAASISSLAGLRVAKQDVFADAAGGTRPRPAAHADLAAQLFGIQAADIDAVQRNPSAAHVVKSGG